MTKTRRNLTIYSGVMLLFGLILTIIFVMIYDRIEVTSTFGGKTLHLGSYIVSDYEENQLDGQKFVSFKVSDSRDFIDKHVVTHEFYIGEKFTTNNSLSNYYLFLVEDVLFTLKYDEDLLMFYIYSGFYEIEFNQNIYLIPYIEMNPETFNQNIFSSFADLKAYYEKLESTKIFDDQKTIIIKAYLKNESNQSVDLSTTIDVILDYSGDDVVVSYNN